ncbi:serine hydrolase [Phytoactinopolyspora limicola]|uniref:serine hydrolase n=1 Tax=Phytoactinopolyspora limicola TaxID=2715536 RepID=UPI00140963FB|nr:serine hydrolase [Phytoactinopolyspora limicola]
MKRQLGTVAIAATILSACTSDTDNPEDAGPGAPTDTSDVASATTEEHGCDPELHQKLAAWAAAGFSGSFVFSTGGELECAAAFGLADREPDVPNTTDTVFGIGSVSKAFTAAAIIDLVDAGELSLEDRAGDVLPDLDGPVAAATIHQLLLHVSGLTGGHSSGDHQPLGRDEAVAAISELEQAFEPGSDYLYSNAGYTLLALIVDEVTDAGYRDYMANQILRLPSGQIAGGFWDGEPAAPGARAVGLLDEGSTGHMGDFHGPHWALSGNGDLAMTVPDLASWTYALFTGGIVAPGSVHLIDEPGFDHGDGMAETPGWVAVDASLLGVPALLSAGGGGDIGHDVVVAWLPDSESVLAIASNTPDISAEELIQAVGPAIATGESVPVPDHPAGDTDPAELEAAVGTYRLETGGSLAVATRDGKLVISATGVDAVAAVFPMPPGIPTEAVAEHEDAVLALLAGDTQEGREERAEIEADFGPVDRIELAGTIYAGELRTYVTVTTESGPIALWYALNEHGGIEAVDEAKEPPAAPFVPVGDDSFRPDDPTGRGPDVTVTFDGERMTLTGPAGSTNALKAG